jgi:branched-chain amino acid transport system substrate-binding protein
MKSKMKLFLVVTLVMVAVFAFSTAWAAKTVKIGYTAPFTGSAAEFGTNGWRGIQIALDEINQEGLMIGGDTYNIEIVRYDSICTPTDGAANVRKMAMQDRVSAILGDHCSSVCNAIAPLCQQFKIPGLTIECAADNVTKPGHEYYFRMRPSVGMMAPLFTPTLIEKFDPQKVGYLVVNDDYGLGLASAVAENFEEAGVESVDPEAFERGTTDFTVYLAKLKQADVDLVFYAGSASEGAMILKQANEMGLSEEVKFVGSEEMGEMELLSLAGEEAVDGTYAVSLWGEVPEEFAQTVKERFDAPMHYAIIFGYDALHTMAKAMEKADSTDPKKIQAALDEIETTGLAGKIKFYDFDGYTNQGKATPSLIAWKDGQRVPLK